MTLTPAKRASRALTAAAIAAALIFFGGGVGPHHTSARQPINHQVARTADDDPGGDTGQGDTGEGDTSGADTGEGDTGGADTGAGEAEDGTGGADNAEPGDTAGDEAQPPNTVDQEAARRAANAARRAQHAAAAARAANAAWNRTGRPDRLIIVRSRNVDLVTRGALTSRVARTPGATLSLKTLSQLLPPGWLTLNEDGTALLSASLLLNGSSALDNGTEVRILRLAGGANRAAAANIWLSHARLRLHNIEVTSFDPATQAPLPDTAAGRPFLVAGAGSTLDLADTTIRSLGAPLGQVPVKPPAPAAPAGGPHAGAPRTGGTPASPAPATPGRATPKHGVPTPGAGTPTSTASAPAVALPLAGTPTSSVPTPGARPPGLGALDTPRAAAPGSKPQQPVRTELKIQPGVLYGQGSTGSISRTELTGNTIGLQLSGSHDVALDTVTVDHSHYDGLVLHGDQGTRLRSVQSSNNGRNGVLVSGPSTPRPITGITAISNTAFGLAVVRQTQPRITGVSVRDDQAGGVRLTTTTGATVDTVSANDEPVGVLVNGANKAGRLTHLRVDGGHNGVVLASSVTGTTVSDSRIADTNGAGVKVSGSHTQLRGVSVFGADTGIRVTQTARTVDAVDNSINGGGDGVIVSRGARAVTLTNSKIDRTGRNGIKNAAANTRIIGGRITGGATGINARAATTISGTAITDASSGVRTSPGGAVAADHIDVLGGNVGVKAETGTTVTVTDSRIRSRDSLRGQISLLGQNIVSPPPFNWIAALGVAFVLLALLLEAMAMMKLRRYRQRVAATSLGGWRPESLAPGAAGVVGFPAIPVVHSPKVEPATAKVPVASPVDAPTSALVSPAGGAAAGQVATSAASATATIAMPEAERDRPEHALDGTTVGLAAVASPDSVPGADESDRPGSEPDHPGDGAQPDPQPDGESHRDEHRDEHSEVYADADYSRYYAAEVDYPDQPDGQVRDERDSAASGTPSEESVRDWEEAATRR